MANPFADFLEREESITENHEKAEMIRHLEKKVAQLEHENDQLKADAKRLDWLSDLDNLIGNVTLPTHCVTANLDNLRAAIDMAMQEPSFLEKITQPWRA